VADLRGHGDSGWSPSGDYGTDRLTADVVHLVEAVGRPAALIGSSLGGRSLLVAAGEATTPLATSLVLVETAARLNDGGAARIGTFLREHLDGFADLDEVADAIAAYRHTPRRPTDEEGLLRVVRRRDDGRYHWHWDARVVVRDGEVVQHRTDAEHARTAAAARRIDVPTVLVRGERSDLVTPEAAAHLRGLIPHCELIEIPGMAHMIAGDRDESLRRDVVEFLRRHRATAAAT
jgi:non-heme chloroperoxidase